MAKDWFDEHIVVIGLGDIDANAVKAGIKAHFEEEN